MTAAPPATATGANASAFGLRHASSTGATVRAAIGRFAMNAIAAVKSSVTELDGSSDRIGNEAF